MRIDARNLNRRLEKFFKVLAPEHLLRLVSTRHFAWIDENFRKAGAEKPWEPLADSTVYARRRGSSRPLQDTGRMKQSFNQKSGARQAVVGTNSRIAGFHHGGTRPFNITPKRAKFLTIPDRDGPAMFTKGRLKGKRGWFSKGVRHPGLPARPLLPSKSLGEDLAQRSIVAALRKAAKSDAG